MTARTTLLLAGVLCAACESDPPAVAADAGAWLAAPSIAPLSAEQVETTLDPYGFTPLSALVTIHGVSPDAVRTVAVTVSGIDGEDLEVTLPYDAAYATRYACPELLDGEAAVQVPVLGLYPSLDNQVRVTLFEDRVIHTASLTITTAALPAVMPTIEIVTAEPALMEPGWNLAGFSSDHMEFRAQPFIYDHHGRIRWLFLAYQAVSPGFVTPLEPLRDGNLVLGIADAVYEYSLLGRLVNQWLLPEGFAQNHDVYEMPDGNLLVTGYQASATIINGDGDTLPMSDQVVEIDRQTGAVRNLWDLRQFLDVDRYAYREELNGQDWFHVNSVVYVPDDDTIIVSGRHQGVVALTRGGVNLEDPGANKALRWILAPHAGWGRAGFDGSGVDLTPYLLTAVDDTGTPWPAATQTGTASSAAFGWPYGQHAAKLLADGSLALFDNGYLRDFGGYTGPPFSRAVTYQVDPDAGGVGGTVRQLWELGRDRVDLYAPIVSNVAEGTVTGNRFMMPGSFMPPPYRPAGGVGGTVEMVEVRAADGQVVFEAHLDLHLSDNDICYRQDRVPLYRE